jgi:hypothetical protein
MYSKAMVVNLFIDLPPEIVLLVVCCLRFTSSRFINRSDSGTMNTRAHNAIAQMQVEDLVDLLLAGGANPSQPVLALRSFALHALAQRLELCVEERKGVLPRT